MTPELPATAADLEAALARCLAADRHALRRDVARLAGDAGRIQRWQERLACSQRLRQLRELAQPRLDFDEQLPVCARRADIAAAIAAHPVLVVAGETGSGKTTQLPKICLQLGRGIDGMIGHTQPRRLAARSVAARIAAETDSAPGDLVGHKVRFTDAVGERTRVKLMTDGILLNEIRHDRLLSRYDTLIIDEAHERSLNIDFLLGYLKQLLPRRPDLKVIITSATIDHERIAAFFGKAPVIEVGGRTYPVETRWRPPEDDSEPGTAVLAALQELAGEPAGDALVFLPGEREIRLVHQYLRRRLPGGTEILPLYARLAASEQDRVFAPHGGRRVVLATNVAETSLTVPGVRYVIDTGLVRLSRYSARSRLQRLSLEGVSQASAEQRKGRCGRVAPGICIRLYDEAGYATRPAHTDPEIRRSNLAGVILQMASLGLGDIAHFPFPDPPDARQVADGWRLLEEIGEVDAQQRLTAVGRQLAQLPLDPRLARMLLDAARSDALAEVLVIVSALAVQDPRDRPHDQVEAADAAHALFADRDSDFLWFRNVWDAFERERQALSRGELRAWCRRHFLSLLRLTEWRETHRQLRLQCQALGWRENAAPAAPGAIHRALLPALGSQVFVRDEGGDYRGTRNRRYAIWPGSALAKKGVQWGVAAEILETRRVWARTVARVQPGWIERAVPHLLRRDYLDIQYERERGLVTAREQVSLQGLVLSAARRVHYGPIAPREAREAFIRAALAQDEDRIDLPFLHELRRRRAAIAAVEERLRRRGLLIDDDRLCAWFEARLPEAVYSRAKLLDWHRQADAGLRATLLPGRDELLAVPVDLDTVQQQWPDVIEVAGARLRVHYRFDPDSPGDGLTIEVPRALLGQVGGGKLEWLVPGWLREKALALARSLPKDLRRQLAPLGESIDAVLAGLDVEERAQPLVDALAAGLRRVRGCHVSAADFDLATLPPWLRPHLRVLDEQGNCIAVAATPEELVAAPPAPPRRHPVGIDDFPSLPDSELRGEAGAQYRVWPALDVQDGVVVREAFGSEVQAQRAHRRALRHLLRELAAPLLRDLARRDPLLSRAALHYRLLGDRDALAAELALAAVDACCLGDAPLPRDAAGLRRLYDARRSGLADAWARQVALVAAALEQWRALEDRLRGLSGIAPATREDIRRQLDALFFPGFVAQVPPEWLREYPRFLKALGLRLDRLPLRAAQDETLSAELAAQWTAWLRLRDAPGSGLRDSPELELLRWMIEEYRVSLFAQQLGTRLPVSAQRLARQRERVG
jgi:ATP-dependent helicase HrpA